MPSVYKVFSFVLPLYNKILGELVAREGGVLCLLLSVGVFYRAQLRISCAFEKVERSRG